MVYYIIILLYIISSLFSYIIFYYYIVDHIAKWLLASSSSVRPRLRALARLRGASSTGTFHPRARLAHFTVSVNQRRGHKEPGPCDPGFEVLANEKQEFIDRTRCIFRRVKETDEIPLTSRRKTSFGQARKRNLASGLLLYMGNNIPRLRCTSWRCVRCRQGIRSSSFCIAGLLYLFRRIWEVVTALPVNGGTYNLLLNQRERQCGSSVPDNVIVRHHGVISSTSAMHICIRCATTVKSLMLFLQLA